jgi:hypothetical protein
MRFQYQYDAASQHAHLDLLALAPNNGEPPSTCLAANIAAVNQVSNLNVNMNNVVGQPFIYNGGLDVNFSVPGASPSQLPVGRCPSSFLNRLFGIGENLERLAAFVRRRGIQLGYNPDIAPALGRSYGARIALLPVT